MRAAALLVAAAALLHPAAAPARPLQDGGKPPATPEAPPLESKSETLHGMRVEILEPAKKPEDGYSLLLFFHGYTGNGKLAATKLAPLAEHGFVVAAPWAKDGAWTPALLESSAAVARDLVERFLVPRERRHVAGIAGGGDGICKIAFEEDLGFRTGTWVCETWTGGSVPKEVKGRLGALFLWGAKEGPTRIDRYRSSVNLLGPKAKFCVAKGDVQEEGLGRARGEDAEIPSALYPFWIHFLGAMEGRFVAGKDLSFDWKPDLDDARMAMVGKKAGGFAYIHSEKPEGEEAERTRLLQNEVFLDRGVRHFADQLVAVKLEKSAAKALMDEAKVTVTPAVVVFKKGGREVLKVVSGEITVKALTPLLRSVAADQEMPR